MNQKELEHTLSTITSQLLNEKGYISMIDLFIRLGYLSAKDVEAWRNKRIPSLEQCIQINLSKISRIMKKVRSNCIKGGLRESYSAYKSWGKGAKITLRFSKTGLEQIEKTYATHFLRPKV
ncbi:MAG: hypothetical protein Q9M31_04220 [Mariprofundus sp.]|nr:hypothetical protein [Mariprofundus sp.]